MRASSAAMRLGGKTKSTDPAVMALTGMAFHWAVFGSCAKVTPPADLIALRPNVPSEPVPERTTPMARLPCSSASATQKSSMGRCSAESAARGPSRSIPLRMVIFLLGGIT